MEPDVLVLDEPTAGLDPRGRKKLWICFISLHKERGFIDDSGDPQYGRCS